MDYYDTRDILVEPVVEPVVEPTELSPIQRLYEGATIFITGATGFMAKIIMEKLLRTCNVDQILILVRDKKGVNPPDRVKQLFNDALFEPLKLKKPEEIRKVTAVIGDCSLPDLGLSVADKERLTNVSIIFHAAATLYMDQLLTVAYKTNVVATKFLLEFARTLPRLQAFLYISTAFSNFFEDIVEEKFYDVQWDADNFQQMCSSLDDTQIGALTPKLTGKWRNTYVLTKACAENLILKYDGILPIAIVRPSVVISTWAEPLLGWINNIYGPIGIIAGVGLGILRVVWSTPDTVVDLIPVDIAANMTIAAAWEVATKNSKPKIYNCVATPSNSNTWNDVIKFSFSQDKEVYSLRNIAVPYFYILNNWFLHWVGTLWYHLMPAFFIDLILAFKGRQIRLKRIYAKVYFVSHLFKPFSVEKQCIFASVNSTDMWRGMDPIDRRLFNFDMKCVNWSLFWPLAIRGLRVYIIKDPMDTLRQAKEKMFWLVMRNYLFLALLNVFMALTVYFVVKSF